MINFFWYLYLFMSCVWIGWTVWITVLDGMQSRPKGWNFKNLAIIEFQPCVIELTTNSSFLRIISLFSQPILKVYTLRVLNCVYSCVKIYVSFFLCLNKPGYWSNHCIWGGGEVPTICDTVTTKLFFVIFLQSVKCFFLYSHLLNLSRFLVVWDTSCITFTPGVHII